MSIKPPPAPFDAAADHARLLEAIEGLASDLRSGRRDGQHLLHQIGRLSAVEQILKALIADGEAARATLNESEGFGALTHFLPFYREFNDPMCDNNGNGGVRLIVQDLHAVWNGKEFEGDGSCTLNKASGDRTHPRQSFVYPQRALILRSNRDPWARVGERNVHGRWFIPPVQSFYFTLEPGDYLVGELYTEIC